MKAGDRVYHYKHGWGNVDNINTTSYSIVMCDVKFDKYRDDKEVQERFNGCVYVPMSELSDDEY